MQISTDNLRFEIDGNGGNAGFIQSGHEAEAVRGSDFWRLILDDGLRTEIPVRSSKQQGKATVKDGVLTVRYDKLVSDYGDSYDITFSVAVTAEDGLLRFVPTLKNGAADVRINECFCPLCDFETLGGDKASDALYLPNGLGRRVENPWAHLESLTGNYYSHDTTEIFIHLHYPRASMGWFGIESGNRFLYVARYDPEMRHCFMTIRQRIHHTPLDLIVGFDHFPMAHTGEELTLLRTSVGTLLRYQNAYLPVGIITAVLCLALFVFLMASMGKTPDGVKLRGIHRVPLDLFLAAALAAVAVPANFYFDLSEINLLYNPLWVWMMPATLMALWIGFVVLLTLCTISARLRAGKWWRNSIIYIVCRFVYRAVRGFVRALPIAWKGILVYAVVVLVNALGMILAFGAGSFFVFLLTLVLDAAGLYFVIHTVRQLKTLQTAAQKLAAGDLTYTVDTEKMYPVLKEHGDNLNAVSVGMSRAVNERMKSERFKTELITNVSHDLKTPLTSIVSYVDLLKKEPTESEAAREYIEVLDRQSQKLKKLTTDLVDASKASSGALPVNLEKIDLGELLRQSAGEYTEKFAAANITPVLNVPEAETYVTADGRLLWRVLDNLLGNAVKYAQSGTRLYLELTPGETETVLTLKNISREPLNIPAEELMERFVRGDGSRHTDGSGLGLSIANSLMELMGGKLTLTLDGDLFKATLVFPQKTV